MNKVTKLTVLGSSLVLGFAFAATAFAQSAPTTATPPANGGWSGHSASANHTAPGVFGTVSAVSGDTLTVTSKAFGGPRGQGGSPTTPAPTPKTYTVDATNATVMKSGAASSVGSIAVGDMVMVTGTVSGTNVTATKINDGIVPMAGRPGMKGGMGPHASSTPAMVIPGNGEPVIGGHVTAVSGSTLTVATAQGGVSYSVDASNAIVEKANATSTVASIAAGDNVVVQGTVSGTSVTAYSVVDQGAPKTSTTGGVAGMGGKFMGVIGGFFKHIFGFF